jgi:hypothetical protein
MNGKQTAKILSDLTNANEYWSYIYEDYQQPVTLERNVGDAIKLQKNFVDVGVTPH